MSHTQTLGVSEANLSNTLTRTPNRRQFDITTVFTGLVKPRRKAARREADQTSPILDEYGWLEMLCAISLLVLSIADATFTLTIIANGGEEINPVMNYFLDQGLLTFTLVKVLIPFFSIFFFVACWNYQFLKIFRMRSFVFASLAVYTTLICYELVLLDMIFPALFTIA